jgi:hypothetical protein
VAGNDLDGRQSPRGSGVVSNRAAEDNISQAMVTALNGIVALCGHAHDFSGREYMRKNRREINVIIAGVQLIESALESDPPSNVVPFQQAAE